MPGIEGVYAQMRALHQALSGVEGLPVLPIDPLMEAYIPGWVAAKRRRILTELLPTMLAVRRAPRCRSLCAPVLGFVRD